MILILSKYIFSKYHQNLDFATFPLFKFKTTHTYNHFKDSLYHCKKTSFNTSASDFHELSKATLIPLKLETVSYSCANNITYTSKPCIYLTSSILTNILKRKGVQFTQKLILVYSRHGSLSIICLLIILRTNPTASLQGHLLDIELRI